MIEKNAEKQEKPQEQRDTDQEYEKNAVDMQGFVGMRNTLDIKQKKESALKKERQKAETKQYQEKHPDTFHRDGTRR